jgi:M6 family metalloprotease-like protein/uncharacterized repeat protein (TIGR02543 family)
MCLRRISTSIYLVCFYLFSPILLHAAPYGPEGMPIEFTQPDGTLLKLRVFGDEFYGRTETEDGFTVVFNPATNSYDLATVSKDGKELVSTKVKAGKGNPKALGLSKRLDISPESRRAKARAKFEEWDKVTGNSKRWAEIKAAMEAEDAKKLAGAQMEGDGSSSGTGDDGPSQAPPSFTTTGTKIGLTLLIDFPDAVATIPQATIVDFCNGDNYTGNGNNGSVKKYFQDNSNGLLTYTNVVTAYVRMAQPKSYYNNIAVDNGVCGRLLINDAMAILKALPNYNSEILPTFSDLTVSGSNVVAFNVFFAGGSSSKWSYGLWPHSWSLNSAIALGNGKSVYKYQLTNIGTSLAIGTFCHENGHMLCGYPDIYDYDYDAKGGAGGFCLMGTGAGTTNPVMTCAYLRRASGWTTVTELTSSSTLTGSLTATVGHADFNKIYRYANPAAPTTEYFLLENRQKTGRDANIGASGIAIWHVDQLGNRDNQSLIPNTSHANYECSLIQADNLWHFQSNTNSGDSKDLYYLGNTAAGYTNTFDDNTGPDANWWSGTPSGFRAYDFSSSGATMTFKVGLPPNSTMVLTPNGGEKIYLGSSREIRWLANFAGDAKIELFKGGVLHTTLATRTANDGIHTWSVSTGLPQGSDYSIKISSFNNPAYADSSDANFTLMPQPTLAESLDAAGLTWTLSGNGNWFAQSNTTKDGVDAAQSGAIGNDQNSSMDTTVTGPGTMTFWWKVSSESTYDFLRFYINGVEQAGSISGEVNWAQKTFNIPSGTQTLKWSYTKDYIEANGSDCGWVDQVVWTPSVPEINITRGGSPVTDGGTDAVTETTNGVGKQLAYTIANSGSANLTLTTPVTATAGTNCSISVNTQPTSTVGVSGTTSLVLTVTPTALGAWSATVSIANNDGDENPYNWTISGTAQQGYTVSYNGNGNTGGTVPVDGTPHVAGETVTTLANTGNLVKTGYAFGGWNTLETGTGTNYAPGSSLVMPANNITLYAKWNIPPSVNAGPDQTVAGTGAAWSPLDLNPVLWLDGTTATIHSGTVSISNRGAGGGVVSGPAALAANGIGTLQAVSFNGSGQYLTGAYANTGTTLTAFFVGKSSSTSQLSYAGMMDVWASGQASDWNNVGSAVLFGQNSTTSNSIYTHRNAVLASATGTLTSPFLAATAFNGTSNTFYLNGTASGSIASTGNFNTANVALGGRWTSSAFNTWWNGNFGEAVICNANLSASDRQKMEGYLAHKWGLAGNLPADHPYKTQSPSTFSAVATLDGTVSDSDGGTVTSTWTKVGGPAAVSFANANAVDTTATFSAEGTYTLRLTANDTFNSSYDECVITVGPVASSYTVTYDGNGHTGGTAPVDSSSPYASGTTVTVLGNTGSLTKTGYTFAGWNTAANGSGSPYAPSATFSMSAANTTLYAQWTQLTVAVVTDTNTVNIPEGGTQSFQVKLSAQPAATVTVAVSRASGDTNITVQSGTNLTFSTANWDTYQTVTLTAANDADADNGSATITCDVSDASYTDKNITATEVDKHATLTVTHDGNGTTLPSGAVIVEKNAATAIAATANTGYDFVNWTQTSGTANFADANSASTTATITAPTTVRANFAIKTYPVTYSGNGHTGGTAPANQSKIHDTDLILRSNSGNLVKTDFVFAGWNTATDGSGTNHPAGSTYTANAPLTLYAKWVPDGGGTWIRTAAGPFHWGDSVNWTDGIVASGADKTASFIPDITADQVANLEAARTIGNILFTDNGTSSHNLTISGTNTLTLDRTSGVPVVDVTQADRMLTIASMVAGSDGLEKTGPGMLIFSNSNTYTGSTTISAGTLRLEGTAFSTTARTYSISSGAILNIASGSIPPGTGTGAATVSGAGTLRISGGITAGGDNRDLKLSMGAGSIIDIVSGGSIVNGGWQAITWTDNKASLNVNGSLSLHDGNPVFADALTGAGAIASNDTTTYGAPGVTLGVNNGSGEFSGNITAGATSRTVNLTKNGTGTQTFSGSTTWKGTTTINGGSLQYAKTSSLYAGVATDWVKAKIIINNGGTIAFNVGGTDEFSTTDVTTLLTGLGGSVNNNGLRAGSTIAFDTSNASGGTFTIANTIANTTGTGGGAVGLQKLGTGTLTLSGPNTYTGNTTISGGTLLITGDQTVATGAVSVASGATLGGTGTIGGSTTIADGGKLEFAISTPTASHNSLELATGKTLTFSGSSELTITSTGDAETGTYTLFTAPGGISGSAPATLNLPAGWAATVSISGNSLVLTVTSVGVGPLDHFAISTIPSPQTVGTPITGITITAQDAANQTVTSFTGTVTFGGTGGFSGTSGNFVNGVLTNVSVTPTIAGSNLTFDVSDGAGHFGSATIATIQGLYTAWSGGTSFDADTNGDGVKDGLAWVLGATSPSGSMQGKLPVAARNNDKLRLTFRCLKSTKRGATQLHIQTSSDLGVTDPWTNHATQVPDTDQTINGIVFDTTDDGDFILVTADIPATETKLFSRLVVTP